ncbi:MAG TPA: DEAD/DEAH box helicase, partial [Armatimonadetes bacterium]|nr:DEAD/DEAH box helicase [Armatimonadota bacterium]
MSHTHPEVLDAFSTPVRAWFERALGSPTPPQNQGWAAIQRGEHTLILAPTGSGKTLAAFLWGIDRLFRERSTDDTACGQRTAKPHGVGILYISPLKALNNDIERNLRLPLDGIRETAESLGVTLPALRVAVRSGDTPQSERQAMLRRPPDILITTPESLYLLLTSPTARGILRRVHTVIIDEIHTLVGTKRGVHLALSLERLQHLAGDPLQRIGLSATIRPLDEAARFLGGCEWVTEPQNPRPDEAAARGGQLHAPWPVPRPVTVVDAHYRKEMDLRVLSPVADHRHLPGGSLWPSLIPHVADLVEEHRSTLIFCNSRRMAERTADRLNVEAAAREDGQPLALLQDGAARGVGIFAAGDGTLPHPIRAHHGSVSREARLEMEQALKAGELPALVATSSLELGIDIGAVELVIQLQAPEGVARGLQRAGRSGHLVGQTSKARIFPTHAEDLIAAAAVAGGMLKGEVETTTTPRNALDVLAQQIVAMVSIETWHVDALYRLVRRAYPYRDLPRSVFDAVLEMLAGRYPTETNRALRPRLSWDRVSNTLAALPGSRAIAVSNGGTIPDSGTFATLLSDGKTRLGELDEEFVYETRVGDVFMLGSQVWRVIGITDDKVSVVPAPGVIPRMPFWKGEAPWRPYELGLRVGEFRRLVAERLRGLEGARRFSPETPDTWQTPAVAGILEWLRSTYALDENSARSVVSYVARQLHAAGAISTDRCIVVESFRDGLGDPRVVIHSPFGGRVNGPWSLAIRDALRERLGVTPEVQSNDDGILLRFPEMDADFPVDVAIRMPPVEASERILREIPHSAVFGARFRQNASRALLLPGARPGKRTPFWLQRLRARELLEAIRRFPDFPILIETYRDCLEDVMDLPHLEEVLRGIQEGRISVVSYTAVTPSPVAQGLLAQFMSLFLYEGDAPRAETQLHQLAMNRALLSSVLKDVALDQFLQPEAIDAMVRQLQRIEPGFRARTAEELAVLLEHLGDLTTAEIEARSHSDPVPWVNTLAGSGRIVSLEVPTASGHEPRWVCSHYASEYACAFALPGYAPADGKACNEARRAILTRALESWGPVTLEAIRTRYAFPSEWLAEALEQLAHEGNLVRGRFTHAAPPGEQFIARRNLEEAHRRTLVRLRREVRPVPRPVYAEFLARWQHAHPATRLQGRDGLLQVLQQLRGLPLAGRAWERDLLPARVEEYSPQDLEALFEGGEVIWVTSAQADPRRARVAFFFRGEGRVCLPALEESEELGPEARAIHDFLKSEGTALAAEIQSFLGLSAQATERGLTELATRGLATCDSLASLQYLLQAPQGSTTAAAPERRWQSSLESQLPRRAPGTVSWRSRRPSRADYQA